jgi:hypothetical protein
LAFAKAVCVNGKYLWALPTPTTFEKVDQIFIFGYKVCANLSKSFPTFAKPQFTHHKKVLLKRLDLIFLFLVTAKD